jgi:flavodoxin
MHIQKIGIFYFSGTGNTKIVANLFANEFQNKGFSTKLIPIEDVLNKKLALTIGDYDLLGFGHPVHAFSAPNIFFDFLDKLPNVDDKKTFTFKTAGDPIYHGGSSSLVKKCLSKKGYKVFHENLIVMPANVMFKYDDSLIKQLYEVAVKKVKRRTEEILLGKTNLQKNNLWLKIGSFMW